MNEDNYLYGECHLFALALHLEFGYQIWLAVDEYDLELEKEVLIHAYCIQSNSAIDVSGVKNVEKILDDYDYNKPKHINVTMDNLYVLMDNGFIHKPGNGQIEEIRNYIKDNKNKFLTS